MQLCPQLVDATMKRPPFVGHLAFASPRLLARERTEPVVQLAPERRDFRLALLELFELECQCLQIEIVGPSHG